MEWLLLGAVIALAVVVLAAVRRRRVFNRGRGAITGRWNRRI
jgi:hypothetical protein